MGQKPEKLKAASYASAPKQTASSPAISTSTSTKALEGVDVFVYWPSGDTDALAGKLNALGQNGLNLSMMDNRGTKVWPNGAPETFCSDQYRCRFLTEKGKTITHEHVVGLLSKVAAAGLDFVKTENLHTFDGQRGYTLAQGE